MSTSLYDKQGYRVNQQGKRMLGDDYGSDVGELTLNNQERFPENQPLSSPEAVSATAAANNNPTELVNDAQTTNTQAEISADNNADEKKALPILLLKQRLKERLGDNELVDKFSHLFDEVIAQNNESENQDNAVVEKMAIAKLATAIYREMLSHVGLVSVLDSSSQDWERAQFQELSFLDNFNAGGSGDPQEIGDQFLRSIMAVSRLKGQSLNEASQEDWQQLSQAWEKRNQELHGSLFQVLREHLLLLSHLRELYLSAEALSTTDELAASAGISAQELMNVQASAPSIGETADSNNSHPEQLSTDDQQLAAAREQISQLTDADKQLTDIAETAADNQHEVMNNSAVVEQNEKAAPAENITATIADQAEASSDNSSDNEAPLGSNHASDNLSQEQSINPSIIEPPPSGAYGGTPLASNVVQSSVVLPKLG